MVKTRFQRAVEAHELNDLRLAFKIDEIREAVFGQQGYDSVLLETRMNYEGKTDVDRGKEMNRVYWSESMSTYWRSVEDHKKFILMMAREEIIHEDRDIASGLLKTCSISIASTSGCAKADEVDLIGHLSPVIGVGDEKDTVTELVEWPRLKGSRVNYPTGSSRFREFCKAKNSVDRIWGHAFGYRGNFFRTCSISQGGDYLYLLPDLAKEKKCRRLGDEVSLGYVQDVVKDSRTDGFCCYLTQFDYGLTLPLSNFAKSVMNMIGACPVERRITAKDFLEYYAVKYVTTTDGAYLSSSSSRPCFFDLSSAGRVWNDNLLWVSGECLQWSDEEPLELNNRTTTKVSRKEYFIEAVAREGTKLEGVLKELEISRFKRVASKDDKLAQLNEMPDGPVDMATISSTAVRNLAKRKAIKRGAASRSVMSDSVDDSSKRRKVTSSTKSQVVLEESDKIAEGVDLRPRFEFARVLRGVHLGFQDREREAFQFELGKEREAAPLKLKEVRAESVAEAERLVTVSATSWNNLAGKLYQLRYTKAEIMAFGERNYEVKEIMDEEEEIESSHHRVVDLEGLLEVEKKSSAELQDVCVCTLCLATKNCCEEYEALISQYEDRLDDNVILSLKPEEAKRQVEDKTATILSRDLALNQLTSELAELREKAVLVVEEREINLDTVRTNLVVSEADLEKLSSSIVGKDQELRNSAQIRDSLIARDSSQEQKFGGRFGPPRESVWRVVQYNTEMNERINQLCARISELERELRVREMKYQKDLKFELDKRDGEIASGEGSREMKEFFRRKEELVENMRIDLTNSRQKSIDLIRQMSDCIDQLIDELA
ncbi:hypothetical protein GIB67_040440 [Kingdonia uniflora]|uniref:Uncharacterized protein n=1 Tax=Kingdonia uniflora TaxID=39325 RepID=A0A7J7KXN0_9MAGN|nr:hypothetical protein GIB67_040440 [Kingdonia uniflora]